ncbi:U-box domain-containing protein 33-like [Carica papaya]|uniref:U-box domain-containing protein 33-like n=1 Tax=Carica papaya TaxID=3649 RepID=UPI000B8CE090|nr:U-box domain-containing protein 33-like [Carica papaya]
MARVVHDDTVCVAVGKDVEESKLTLLWALESLQARTICILHVHQPAQMIFNGNFLVDELGEDELRTIKEVEIKIMYRILDDYLDICRRAGVLSFPIDELYVLICSPASLFPPNCEYLQCYF